MDVRDMDKEAITEAIIENFVKNINYFHDIVVDGDIVGILSFLYTATLDQLPFSKKAKMMQQFINQLVSTIALSFFPIMSEPDVEKKFSSPRLQLFHDIVETINNSGERILKELGIDEFPTTIH